MAKDFDEAMAEVRAEDEEAPFSPVPWVLGDQKKNGLATLRDAEGHILAMVSGTPMDGRLMEAVPGMWSVLHLLVDFCEDNRVGVVADNKKDGIALSEEFVRLLCVARGLCRQVEGRAFTDGPPTKGGGK